MSQYRGANNLRKQHKKSSPAWTKIRLTYSWNSKEDKIKGERDGKWQKIKKFNFVVISEKKPFPATKHPLPSTLHSHKREKVQVCLRESILKVNLSI